MLLYIPVIATVLLVNSVGLCLKIVMGTEDETRYFWLFYSRTGCYGIVNAQSNFFWSGDDYSRRLTAGDATNQC